MPRKGSIELRLRVGAEAERIASDLAPPPATKNAQPSQAELKVRVALAALDQAAVASANRSVGLDTKASILLVLAGVVATATLSGDGLLYRIATVFALGASLFALLSLWPRQLKGVHPKTVTDHLTSHAETLGQFEYWLLALQNSAAIKREQRMKTRGLLLTIGFVSAVVSTVLVGLSVMGEGDWLAKWIATYTSTLEELQPTVVSTPAP